MKRIHGLPMDIIIVLANTTECEFAILTTNHEPQLSTSDSMNALVENDKQ